MNFLNYWNRTIQQYQNKSWRSYDTVCPYCIGHADIKGSSQIAQDRWFEFYHRASPRLRKLYWRLHPNERFWIKRG